ncbi:unnamed protein product [Caenorhabditis brenneri]
MNFEEIPRVIFLVFLSACGAIFFLYLLWIYVCETFAFFKSFRKGPITLTPVIPFPQDDLQVFKGTDRLRNVVPDAKIQVNWNTDTVKAHLFTFWRKDGAYKVVNAFMASTFKLHSRLPHEYEEVRSETGEKHYKLKPKISVPVNARTISIKMDGYEHGDECHDFVPVGGAAPGSHFTYQMYGDNRIQVTRYVVDGESEIAGFCIYIEHPWISSAEYKWRLLTDMAQFAKTSTLPEATERREIIPQMSIIYASSPITEREIIPQLALIYASSPITEKGGDEKNQPKIKMDPEENSNLLIHDSDDREWTGKYCSKRRRIMLSSMDSGEVVVHQEWSDRNNQMRIEKCEECTKEGLGKEEQPPAYSSIFFD